MTDTSAAAGKRFRRDTAEHTMTVLHDDGLYRHLRFNRPGSSIGWFDLITWPGCLAFQGDGNGFVFSRSEDMFQFFRSSSSYGVNPHYWAEKVVAGREAVQKYSEDTLRTFLKEFLSECEQDYPELVARYERAQSAFDKAPRLERWPHSPDGPRMPDEPTSPNQVRQIITDADADGLLSYETGARELLRQMEVAGVVSDTWDLSLHDFDWWYLWCCHAIVWGISQYDAAARLVVSA